MKFRTSLDRSSASEDARATQERVQRHWHLASVGLGNCRAAQALKREIDRRSLGSQPSTQTAAASTGIPMQSGPAYPQPSGVGEAARAIKDLLQRHWHFASVGLGNCRAAQATLRELNEQLLIQSAALANANFNPKERRDWHGRWTTGNDEVGHAANAPTVLPEPKPPQAELRPLTTGEKLASDLRELEHKLLPGTRTGQLNPTRISDGFVGIAKGLQKLGEFAKAVVGDVAAGMRADPEFSGNIPAFFKGEELPIDKALRDAAQEQKFRGEIPVATVMGRISEGLASTAPMIPLTGGLPAAAQKVALAAFTAKMVKDTPAIARQLGTEFGQPPDQRDPDKIDSLVAQAIQTVGFAAVGGVGLKRSLRPNQPAENIPAERRDIQRREPGADTPATASTASGPYSHLPDSPSVGPGKDFTPSQKARMLSVNETRNSGAKRRPNR